MTGPTVYIWCLTPHERAALLTVLAEYLSSDHAVEVSIDAATGHEIPIGELLTKVMLLDPMVLQRPTPEEEEKE